MNASFDYRLASRRILSFIIALIVSWFMLQPLTPSPARAVELPGGKECSEEYLRSIGALVVNCKGITDVSPCGTVGSAQNPNAGRRVFVVGDSLTYGMVQSGDLMTELATKGFLVTPDFQPLDTNTSSPRVTGSSVEATGGINTVDSITRLNEHPDDISQGNADIILVGLGTNREADFTAKVTAFTSYLKGLNPSATIVWVNTYYTASRSTAYTTVNDELTAAAQSAGILIIDIAAAALDDASLAPDGGDGVHYSPNGYKARSAFIAGELQRLTQGAGSASAAGNSSGSALTLGFPLLSNEAEVASNMTEYIQTNRPSSPWLTVSPNIGQWIFDKSREMGVNPLLVASIGKQENQFGTSTSTSVDNFNYFGMKMTSRADDPRIGGIIPNDIEGSSYMGFDTPAEGIEFFIRYLAINTQGDNRGPYRDVQNFYEYIAMHQAGQIAYPGEPLVGGDGEMDVSFSWDSNWNPLIYYENSIAFINEITGLNLSPVPTRGAVPASCTGPGSGTGSGLIDSTGYTFPLDVTSGTIGGITVGQTESIHHDETPAFDLFGPAGAGGGDKVYALYSGTIVNISEQDPGWCYGIQFLADDGFYYFYGHLNNIQVTEGQQVGVEHYLGDIAEWTEQHTCNGTSKATHLHIDRGCVLNINGTPTPQPAGDDECRDPDFIPFLSGVYERLLGAAGER